MTLYIIGFHVFIQLGNIELDKGISLSFFIAPFLLLHEVKN